MPPLLPQLKKDNTPKLNFYKCFKQVKDGDVTGSQPWAVQIDARLKYDAWATAKGTSKEDAMQACVDEMERQKAEQSS